MVNTPLKLCKEKTCKAVDHSIDKDQVINSLNNYLTNFLSSK